MHDTSANTIDDFELMRRIAVRDDRALADLYDRHSALLFALGMRILNDRGEAEDFLIELFWEIWNRADRYDAARGAPITYLITLGRCRAIDLLRSRAHRPRNSSSGGLESADLRNELVARTSPQRDAMDSEQRRQIADALGALDPDQRRAVELSFFEGLTHSEIAAQLEKPLGTIKTHIRQGLIHLRLSLRTTG